MPWIVRALRFRRSNDSNLEQCFQELHNNAHRVFTLYYVCTISPQRGSSGLRGPRPDCTSTSGRQLPTCRPPHSLQPTFSLKYTVSISQFSLSTNHNIILLVIINVFGGNRFTSPHSLPIRVPVDVSSPSSGPSYCQVISTSLPSLPRQHPVLTPSNQPAPAKSLSHLWAHQLSPKPLSSQGTSHAIYEMPSHRPFMSLHYRALCLQAPAHSEHPLLPVNVPSGLEGLR